jgi:hypothetical protein
VVEGVAIEFNGNYEDYEYVEVEGNIFVKIKPEPISIDEIIGSTCAYVSNLDIQNGNIVDKYTNEFIITEEFTNMDSFSDTQYMIQVMSDTGMPVLFVIKGDLSSFGVPLTEGVYFVYIFFGGGYMYTQSCSAFSGQNKIVHKIDEKYLPCTEDIQYIKANIVGKKGLNHSEVFNDYETNVASGDYSHVEGYGAKATGHYSHAEGWNTTASESNSHAEGWNTTASGPNSHAEGYKTEASGTSSHAEGYETAASGYYSHAEGHGTTASGESSHAEGDATTASGYYSHAEGHNSKAEKRYSHAEGFSTQALGESSHAEGYSSKASGFQSHAEGASTIASGQASHAEGSSTIASSAYQHVQGIFNIEDTEKKYLHIVGNGIYNNRSNAHTLDWQGNAEFQGDVKANACGGSQSISLIDIFNRLQLLETLLANVSYDAENNTYIFNANITTEGSISEGTPSEEELNVLSLLSLTKDENGEATYTFNANVVVNGDLKENN